MTLVLGEEEERVRIVMDCPACRCSCGGGGGGGQGTALEDWGTLLSPTAKMAPGPMWRCPYLLQDVVDRERSGGLYLSQVTCQDKDNI